MVIILEAGRAVLLIHGMMMSLGGAWNPLGKDAFYRLHGEVGLYTLLNRKKSKHKQLVNQLEA